MSLHHPSTMSLRCTASHPCHPPCGFTRVALTTCNSGQSRNAAAVILPLAIEWRQEGWGRPAAYGAGSGMFGS